MRRLFKLARPVKKSPEQWKSEILSMAQKLIMSKGYKETSVSDIMKAVGGAKGMFYHFFESKENIMQLLGDQMFFENNPFDAVKCRKDLNGLQKIRKLLMINQSETERNEFNIQAIPILKDPHILAAAIQSNRRVLTPLWFGLLKEGRQDGSIQTEYAKEISELLPLINFWLLPSVYPDTPEGIRHKFHFIMEVLAKMGLPILDDELTVLMEKQLSDILPKPFKEE